MKINLKSLENQSNIYGNAILYQWKIKIQSMENQSKMYEKDLKFTKKQLKINRDRFDKWQSIE